MKSRIEKSGTVLVPSCVVLLSKNISCRFVVIPQLLKVVELTQITLAELYFYQEQTIQHWLKAQEFVSTFKIFCALLYHVYTSYTVSEVQASHSS